MYYRESAMGRNVSSTKPWYKHFFDGQSFLFYLLVMIFFLSALFIFIFWVEGWLLWILGLLIMAAWTPLVVSTMRAIYQRHRWLAFLYLLVVTQAAHTVEHLAQMVEMHILGRSGPKASGVIGFLDIEWVHLTWNSLVLLAVFMLLFAYRRNIWLWTLFVFAIYHEVEHIYMVSVYLRTGVPGNPGLLARGGLVWGGLPISRPDLHALYAVLEVAMLAMIYMIERRNALQAQTQQNGTA